MQSLPDEKIGDALLRIVSQGGVYRGTIIREGRRSDIDEDADLDPLRARLRNAAGKLHPDYLGMDGAISRFLQFFPGGFEDPAFGNERDYKQKAQARLQSIISVDDALTATRDQAIAVRRAFSQTNVLHSTEFARIHEVLGSDSGAPFVRAAARFTLGETGAGLGSMVAAIAPHGRPSWPLLTYLPSLWLPEEHMFLKPEVTRDYATRIGHPFQFAYRADPDPMVYEALLTLITDTECATKPLGSLDRTDVQSFIWVVGAYRDTDLPHLEKLRVAASG